MSIIQLPSVAVLRGATMKVMARNYNELQAKMNPASRADNTRRVREVLRRIAADEVRRAIESRQADTHRE